MIMLNYIASFFLITLGLYTIVTKHNLVKTVIGLSIADYGVNLLLISIGFNPGGTAPLFTWPDSDQHRYRRLRHRHVPGSGHQAGGAVWHH